MSEWQEFQLGKLYSVSSGLSKPKEYFGEGEIFISFKDVFNNWFLPFEPEGRVISNEKDQITCSVKKGDILITRTSETSEEVGMSSVALKDYPKSTFNGFCKRLRPKKDAPIQINPLYIGYLLRDRFFRKTVAQYATMTTRASLNGASIKRITLKFPSPEEQKEIGQTLYNFDRKIQLLQEQNKTLENLAQTLFKEWFGKYQVGDELPEGWKISYLSEIAEFLNGLALQKFPPKNDGTDLPVVKIKELKNGITSNTDLANNEIEEKYIVENGDIIFSWSGSLEVKIWEYGKGALNQHLFKVTSENYPKWFFYLWVKTHIKAFRKIAHSKATTMGHINRKHLDQAEILIPSEEIMKKLNLLFQPLLKKLELNNSQIQKLQKTRDTLLPKLMNGLVRVKEFQH